MSNLASAIKAAEAALDKGDYGFCIKIIDPLLSSFSAETTIGAQLRLLLVTAYMGRGDERQAINISQLIINNKEGSIRQQAKQLLSILDAPSLPRPSNWSVEIPKLEIEASQKSSLKKSEAFYKKLPNSSKIYVDGAIYSDLKVGMRKIKLDDHENKNFVVYDTAGPYSEDHYKHDYNKG